MIRRRIRSLRESEGGFTLIELLVTVVIMGIITVPLGNFMLEYLANATDTQDRISDSHDMQIATAYFSQDVGNTGMHATAAPYAYVASAWKPTSSTLPSPYCGQGAGSLVLLLKWDAWTVATAGGASTGTNDPASVAYVNEAGVLHRIYCATGTAASADVTLVHNLSAASVNCGASANCDSPTPPAVIKLTLTIAGTGDRAAPDPVTITGQRRQS
jgi:prepilin-type N-terminal cleavage/methylation domain-containing protein